MIPAVGTATEDPVVSAAQVAFSDRLKPSAWDLWPLILRGLEFDSDSQVL